MRELRMSNEELIAALKAAWCDESNLMARCIARLAEVDERRLYLDVASPSLFDFCVRKIGMSEGEAFRRMTAARLVRKHPQILEALEARRVQPLFPDHQTFEPAKPSSTEKPHARGAASTPAKSVPAAARRAVMLRDQEQCTFMSEAGERCPARDFLEIDHRHPRALGGTHEISNLRLLCRSHNRGAAERLFGIEYIARAIDVRRRTSARNEHVPPAARQEKPSGD